MDTFLKILRYLSGPLVGALIGYLTNYLAVKMLFRPYKAKYIGKWKIPFTPGVIPKRKPQLAKSIGKAVEEKLLTNEDVQRAIASDETKKAAVAAIVDKLYAAPTTNDLLLTIEDENKLQTDKARLADALSEKLVNAAKGLRLGERVASEGGRVVKEKKASLGMLAMLVSDSLIDDVCAKMAERIDEYVDKEGKDLLLPQTEKEIDALCAREISAFLPKERCEEILSSLFERFLDDAVRAALQNFRIAAIVEEKINAMDVRELEELCLSVMKKELNAVVNLGALLGLLIGILNCFF